MRSLFLAGVSAMALVACTASRTDQPAGNVTATPHPPRDRVDCGDGTSVPAGRQCP